MRSIEKKLLTVSFAMLHQALFTLDISLVHKIPILPVVFRLQFVHHERGAVLLILSSTMYRGVIIIIIL